MVWRLSGRVTRRKVRIRLRPRSAARFEQALVDAVEAGVEDEDQVGDVAVDEAEDDGDRLPPSQLTGWPIRWTSTRARFT